MENLELLKDDAQKKVEEMLQRPLNLDELNVLASLMTILNYPSKTNQPENIVIPSEPQLFVETAINDEIEGVEILKTPVDIKFEESEKYYDDFVKEKSLWLETGNDVHKQYAQKYLINMLRADSIALTMIYQAGDPVERQKMKEVLSKMVESFK